MIEVNLGQEPNPRQREFFLALLQRFALTRQFRLARLEICKDIGQLALSILDLAQLAIELLFPKI